MDLLFGYDDAIKWLQEKVDEGVELHLPNDIKGDLGTDDLEALIKAFMSRNIAQRILETGNLGLIIDMVEEGKDPLTIKDINEAFIDIQEECAMWQRPINPDNRYLNCKFRQIQREECKSALEDFFLLERRDDE